MSEFLHHYFEIVSDPAHMAAEITFMLAIDVLVLGMLWPLVRKAIDRRIHTEHLAIDAEHGVEHDDRAAYVARHRATTADEQPIPASVPTASMSA